MVIVDAPYTVCNFVHTALARSVRERASSRGTKSQRCSLWMKYGSFLRQFRECKKYLATQVLILVDDILCILRETAKMDGIVDYEIKNIKVIFQPTT